MSGRLDLQPMSAQDMACHSLVSMIYLPPTLFAEQTIFAAPISAYILTSILYSFFSLCFHKQLGLRDSWPPVTIQRVDYKTDGCVVCAVHRSDDFERCVVCRGSKVDGRHHPRQTLATALSRPYGLTVWGYDSTPYGTFLCEPCIMLELFPLSPEAYAAVLPMLVCRPLRIFTRCQMCQLKFQQSSTSRCTWIK